MFLVEVNKRRRNHIQTRHASGRQAWYKHLGEQTVFDFFGYGELEPFWELALQDLPVLRRGGGNQGIRDLMPWLRKWTRKRETLFG